MRSNPITGCNSQEPLHQAIFTLLENPARTCPGRYPPAAVPFQVMSVQEDVASDENLRRVDEEPFTRLPRITLLLPVFPD
jgi:hypothetical protein